MQFGITMFVHDESIAPDDLARAVEERGLDSLFLPEHSHVPVQYSIPAWIGQPLPGYFAHMLDPFVALTAAAAATERIRLGTAVCLLAQRDPIVTAKVIATLDLLSR